MKPVQARCEQPGPEGKLGLPQQHAAFLLAAAAASASQALF